MLSKQQLESLKKELVSYKKELTAQLKGNGEDADIREAFGELSVNDNHPADLGTELFEREKDLALQNHAEAELEKAEAALHAIDAGSYGKCVVCGKEIDYDRLKAIPTSLYCREHTRNRSINEERPVEEEVLGSPHGDRLENPIDGDDIVNQDTSFQKVARYGTSETPSDFIRDGKNYDSLYGGKEENEGITEDMEAFSASDIKGKDRQVFRSQKEKEYEERLDAEHLESPLGDIPYKRKDSYLQKDRDHGKRKGSSS